MATCIWKPNAVWKRNARDLQPASYHNSCGRYGGDHDGLDPTFGSVPAALELHLLHLRLIAPELCRRVSLFTASALNATSLPPIPQKLSSLPLDASATITFN